MLHQGDRIQQHINPRLFVFLYQHTHTDWAGVMRRPIPHIVIERFDTKGSRVFLALVDPADIAVSFFSQILFNIP